MTTAKWKRKIGRKNYEKYIHSYEQPSKVDEDEFVSPSKSYKFLWKENENAQVNASNSIINHVLFA